MRSAALGIGADGLQVPTLGARRGDEASEELEDWVLLELVRDQIQRDLTRRWAQKGEPATGAVRAYPGTALSLSEAP